MKIYIKYLVFFQNMNLENPLYYLNKLKTNEGELNLNFNYYMNYGRIKRNI